MSTDRASRLAALEDLAERQASVAARWQLRGLGWTPGQVDHEIGYGRWRVVAPSVVALQNADLTDSQREWVGVLHGGPDAALSHLTAARRGGLRLKGDDRIHVMTSKGRLVTGLPGYVFHQTRRPYREWLQVGGSGPRRLRPEYASLLAAERDQRLQRGIGLLAAAVQQRLTTAERLASAAQEIRKLRNGREFLLALGDISGGAQSFAEINVGRLCAEHGLAQPTRQAIRTDAAGRRRYLDCEWLLPDGRVLVLEVDGSFHLRVGSWWRDMKRERSVVVSGSVVLRCSSIELRLEPEDVVRDLREAGAPVAGSVCVSSP